MREVILEEWLSLDGCGDGPRRRLPVPRLTRRAAWEPDPERAMMVPA